MKAVVPSAAVRDEACVFSQEQLMVENLDCGH